MSTSSEMRDESNVPTATAASLTAVNAIGKNEMGCLSTLKYCKPEKMIAASSSCLLSPYVMKVTNAHHQT